MKFTSAVILLWLALLASPVFATLDCKTVLRYFTPPLGIRIATFISTHNQHDLAGETREARIMNGSVVVASTPQGEKTVFVLSDMLEAHNRHPGYLPKDWKVVRYVHRGEFEIKNGVILRANETSGSAFLAGQADANKVENLMEYLKDCNLVTAQTDFNRYDKDSLHYYNGFDEPGGTPKGLHNKRDAFLKAIDLMRTVLTSGFEEILISDKEILPQFKEHWAVYTAGLTAAERAEVEPLRSGIAKLAEGTAITKAEVVTMLAAVRLIDKKIARPYVIEVK